MELIVHGTIGGLANLYSQTQQIEAQVLFDSRALNPKTEALGQEAYALQFHTFHENDQVIKSFCIFSKYIVVRDLLGDGRMGFIAFSIFCPNDKKISGNEMQSLLDAIASNYIRLNVKNNTLGNAKIDWTAIENIIERYGKWLGDIKPSYYVEKFYAGLGEPAYVYYRNNDALHRYFDDPYQEEYKPYKQVLFVKSDYEGKVNNPLNALRHDPGSNLTGKIENPEYTLDISNKNNLKITVRFKDVVLRHGDKIKRNHTIEIAFSKPYRMSPPSIRGKAGDLCKTYPDYFEISKDGRLCIKYRELDKLRKWIKFNLFDSDGRKVWGMPYITIENKIRFKPANDELELVFTGDEIGKEWNILFETDNLRGTARIIPSALNHQNVIMKGRKKIVITAIDAVNKTAINRNLQIVVDGIYKTYDCEIEFFGEEIFKTHEIEVLHKDFKPYKSPQLDMRFRDKIEVHLTPKVTPVNVSADKKETPTPAPQNLNHWGGNQSATCPPGSLYPDKSKREQKSKTQNKTGAGTAQNNQQPQKGNFWSDITNFWSK